MASAHKHLEHAEHAGHHAADQFDRRVAVTMAIIAALLAGIGTQSHRKHNEVLREVGEANRLRTEAASALVESSDLYGWAQAKKNRQLQYQMGVVLAGAVPADRRDDAAKAAVAEWAAQLDKYAHPKDPDDDIDAIRARARKRTEDAAALTREADAIRAEATHAHHQADRLDLGHLLAEVGIVLCTVAVLTKRRSYWLGGILAAVVAIAAAGSSYLMVPHATSAAQVTAGGH